MTKGKYIRNKETLKKLAEAREKAKEKWTGQHHKEETIEKIRSGKLGNRNPMYNKSAWNKTRTEKYKIKTRRLGDKKVNESHIVWCSQLGNLPYIPNGMVIHHLDLNQFNNIPSNLIMLDRATHNRLHSEIIKNNGVAYG
jgi:hypothetical protein